MTFEDDEIYRKHRSDLVHYASSLVVPDRAEDVLSTVLVRVLDGGGIARLDDPRPYLFRAVLNKARSVLQVRFRRVFLAVVLDSPRPPDLDPLPSSDIPHLAPKPSRPRWQPVAGFVIGVLVFIVLSQWHCWWDRLRIQILLGPRLRPQCRRRQPPHRLTVLSRSRLTLHGPLQQCSKMVRTCSLGGGSLILHSPSSERGKGIPRVSRCVRA